MTLKDEWTQQEFLEHKKELEASGVKVLLVDTILAGIDGVQTVLYNPVELLKEPKGSVFVFYCDTGKNSLSRLPEYKKRFVDYGCVSLKGGRAYWRKGLR